jgi:hypothetical protein
MSVGQSETWKADRDRLYAERNELIRAGEELAEAVRAMTPRPFVALRAWDELMERNCWEALLDD